MAFLPLNTHTRLIYGYYFAGCACRLAFIERCYVTGHLLTNKEAKLIA